MYSSTNTQDIYHEIVWHSIAKQLLNASNHVVSRIIIDQVHSIAVTSSQFPSSQTTSWLFSPFFVAQEIPNVLHASRGCATPSHDRMGFTRWYTSRRQLHEVDDGDPFNCWDRCPSLPSGERTIYG